MIDLTGPLSTAEKARDLWSPEGALSTASRIAGHSGLVTDWDSGAGEEWITLLRDGTPCALVGVGLPLVFVLDTEDAVWPSPVVVVEIPSMTRPMLHCRREILETVFGRQFSAMELYPAGFSALDLAMMTI